MSANDQLLAITGRIRVGIEKPGDIDVNVANEVTLHSDFEYGWLCALTKDGEIAGVCSEWHATPDAAVADLFAQVERKYPRP